MKHDYSLVYFNLKNKFSNDYSYIPKFDFGNSGICSRISDMEKYNYNKIIGIVFYRKIYLLITRKLCVYRI